MYWTQAPLIKLDGRQQHGYLSLHATVAYEERPGHLAEQLSDVDRFHCGNRDVERNHASSVPDKQATTVATTWSDIGPQQILVAGQNPSVTALNPLPNGRYNAHVLGIDQNRTAVTSTFVTFTEPSFPVFSVCLHFPIDNRSLVLRRCPPTTGKGWTIRFTFRIPQPIVIGIEP